MSYCRCFGLRFSLTIVFEGHWNGDKHSRHAQSCRVYNFTFADDPLSVSYFVLFLYLKFAYIIIILFLSIFLFVFIHLKFYLFFIVIFVFAFTYSGVFLSLGVFIYFIHFILFWYWFILLHPSKCFVSLQLSIYALILEGFSIWAYLYLPCGHRQVCVGWRGRDGHMCSGVL